MDYSILIEFLKLKREISSLEKDLLDTWNELQKHPFDLDSSRKQIQSNISSYPDIWAKVSALPTTTTKPQEQITETDNRYILQCHLAILAEKEAAELNCGK